MRLGLPPPDRHTLLDLFTVGVSALMGVALALAVPHDAPVTAEALLTACLLLSATLLWRRTAPLTVLWITTAAGLLAIATALTAGPLFGTEGAAHTVAWFPPTAPFAAYAAATRRPLDPVFWISLSALSLACLLAADPTTISGTGVRTLLFADLAATLGLYLATHQRLVAALRERAQRAENEQHLMAERARGEERARLATEMHDIVSHRVSLMVLQAGALRVTAPDDTVRSTAEELRATGHRALGELRDLTGVLSQGGDLDPLTDPDPLPLVEDARATGTPVDLDTQGDPALASPLVAATVARVLQEALTNTRKHAPGARVRVQLSYTPTAIHVRVHNGAPTGAPDPDLVASGSSCGLDGLRRRAELLGGALTARPTDTGGFETAATLPSHVPVTERTGR
ncbi:sensor histidine kinase [Nocardiopsis nanhaiensis]